jgi:hypothetical protein
MFKQTSVVCARCLVLLITLLVVACGAPTPSTSAPVSGTAAPHVTAPPVPVLIDLNTPEDLKVRFNQDAGVPRLILLVSPT